MPFFSRKGDPLQNPYELLDLKYGATDDEISKAFKKLMFTLHPDKQPPGQSPEEAELVAQMLHDVMDAKSFLLDGEYLTARREYDAKLARAAMQPPPFAAMPPITVGEKNCSGTANPTQKTAPTPGSAPGKGNNNSNNYSDPQLHAGHQQQHPDLTVDNNNNDTPKTAVRFKTNPLPKGKVHVKQWGKAKKTHRDRGRSCPATSRQETSGARAGDFTIKHRIRNPSRVATTTNNSNNDDQKVNDVNYNYNNGFDDSNGECSTTDECGSNSDDGHDTNVPTTNIHQQQTRDSRGRSRTVDHDTDSKNSGGEWRRPNSSKPATRVQHQNQHHPAPKAANISNVSDKQRSKSDEGGGGGVGSNAATRHHTKRKPQSNSYVEERFNSLREAVHAFIKDLPSGSSSSSIVIPPLDSMDTTSFSYLGLLFHLEVPSGVGSDKIMVQTWYKMHRKNSTQIISSMVGQFNARLHKADTGCRLTFRNMNGKYAFTLTKKADPEHFSKKSLRHGIEYFMEMSIKLHNLINPMDMKKVDRVRLTS